MLNCAFAFSAIGNGALIAALVFVVIIAIIIIANIRIVPQASVYVIERLGSFYQEWHTGPHFLIPFFDHVVKVIQKRNSCNLD